jgi:hypothetical protein
LNQRIEESRGELADYNMVLDRLNTTSSVSELRNDYSNLKLHNDQETKSLDLIFIEKGKYVLGFLRFFFQLKFMCDCQFDLWWF